MLFTEPSVAWRAQFLFTQNGALLRLITYVTDEQYREDRQQQVMELVQRINDEISLLGFFGFSHHTGAVTYRATLDLRRRTLSKAAVTSLLNSACFPIRVWQHSFALVREGGRAYPALGAARVLVGAAEDHLVTAAVRKLLLRVEQGGTSDDLFGAFQQARLTLL